MKSIQSAVSLFFAAVILAVSPLAVAHKGGWGHANDIVPHPLHHAAFHNDVEEIKRLLADGADVNAEGKYDWFDLSRLADRNAKESNTKSDLGMTALHAAAVTNAKEAAEILLASGADVNAGHDKGGTPLLLANLKNAKETAEVLRNSLFPLHYAAANNDTAEVKRLLDSGTNVNEPGYYGETALHVAARENAQETAELLLDSQTLVNAKAGSGFTPLHFAVYNNHINMVKYLLANGADPDIADKEYKTAWDLAKGKPKITFFLNQWLEEWKAKQIQISGKETPSEPEVKEKSWAREFADWWDSL